MTTTTTQNVYEALFSIDKPVTVFDRMASDLVMLKNAKSPDERCQIGCRLAYMITQFIKDEIVETEYKGVNSDNPDEISKIATELMQDLGMSSDDMQTLTDKTVKSLNQKVKSTVKNEQALSSHMNRLLSSIEKIEEKKEQQEKSADNLVDTLDKTLKATNLQPFQRLDKQGNPESAHGTFIADGQEFVGYSNWSDVREMVHKAYDRDEKRTMSTKAMEFILHDFIGKICEELDDYPTTIELRPIQVKKSTKWYVLELDDNHDYRIVPKTSSHK